jgi:hypothetical protein
MHFFGIEVYAFFFKTEVYAFLHSLVQQIKNNIDQC